MMTITIMMVEITLTVQEFWFCVLFTHSVPTCDELSIIQKQSLVSSRESQLIYRSVKKF